MWTFEILLFYSWPEMHWTDARHANQKLLLLLEATRVASKPMP